MKVHKILKLIGIGIASRDVLKFIFPGMSNLREILVFLAGLFVASKTLRFESTTSL